jgi:hypothetical protein
MLGKKFYAVGEAITETMRLPKGQAVVDRRIRPGHMCLKEPVGHNQRVRHHPPRRNAAALQKTQGSERLPTKGAAAAKGCARIHAEAGGVCRATKVDQRATFAKGT